MPTLDERRLDRFALEIVHAQITDQITALQAQTLYNVVDYLIGLWHGPGLWPRRVPPVSVDRHLRTTERWHEALDCSPYNCNMCGKNATYRYTLIDSDVLCPSCARMNPSLETCERCGSSVDRRDLACEMNSVCWTRGAESTTYEVRTRICCDCSTATTERVP